jgi:phosphotransferase system enzyme I (PtsP)
MTVTGGRTGLESGGEPRRNVEFSASRMLLRRLVEVVAEPISPQQRLDRIVELIAANLVAEVCSVYFNRAGETLELFATVGLAAEAVHRTRMGVGEGLVGTISAQGKVINTADAQSHPNFRYFPETREEIYHSFLGVPILRVGKVVGVLTVQNRARKAYAEDDIEALQVIASILAEMFASGELIDQSKYADVTADAAVMRRLDGARLVEGVAIGRAWLHEPRVEVTRLLAESPQVELTRLDRAIGELREALDQMLATSDLVGGEQREVLEAYRMFAHDTGWLRRIREAIGTGLSAEAAVRRVQEETRVRIGHASDPYLRERLIDLDDIANRLLRHLVGKALSHDPAGLPEDTILVARNLGAADLLEYDRRKLRGVVLEEGSKTAHVTIVARAIGIPMVGRIEGVMAALDPGNPVVLDGDNGHVYVRPNDEIVQAFHNGVRARAERKRYFDQIRTLPSLTADGIPITLSINAAFLIDLAEMEAVGAEGCGLFRTEFAFMTRSRYPDVHTQAAHYRDAMDTAGARPVAFRTLDVGSDKHLPYWRLPPEDNPAMGWRALRMVLDRPTILRGQLRALVLAASGRHLQVMFPMVAEVAELEAARRLLDMELARAAARGIALPTRIEVGAMVEVPSLYWQLTALLKRVDFLSIGSNDLFQFLFACDRGNPALVDRYDVLSPPAMSFFHDMVQRCRGAGVRLAVCGEMASRPLEAMALIGLGVHCLSLTPSEVGPVKAMLRSLDAARLGHYLRGLLELPDHSLRGRLQAYALDHGVVLPPNVYQPF